MVEEQLIQYGISAIVAVIYSVIGYVASKEKFDAKKFGLTILIQLAAAAGIVATGADVYVSTVAPSTITYFVTKLINAIRKKPAE